jgi:hypothetical protein
MQSEKNHAIRNKPGAVGKKNPSPLVKGERLVRLGVNAVMQEQSELLSTGGKAEDGNSLTS